MSESNNIHSFSDLEAHLESMRIIEDAVMQDTKAKKEDAQEAEGKKRKAATQKSRGVEKLKKANIKGMSKLSSFFQKTVAVPKAWTVNTFVIKLSIIVAYSFSYSDR